MVNLKDSETAIICICQSQGFAEEMANLTKGNSSVKGNNPIFNLDPTLDRELLRHGGRLARAEMAKEAIHPAIIPKVHHVSKLVLRQIHLKTSHGERNHLLSEARQKNSIPSAKFTCQNGNL